MKALPVQRHLQSVQPLKLKNTTVGSTDVEKAETTASSTSRINSTTAAPSSTASQNTKSDERATDEDGNYYEPIYNADTDANGNPIIPIYR